MLLQEPVNPVKNFVQYGRIGQIDQANMAFPEFRGKAAPVNQQNVFLVEEVEHECLVIGGPLLVG